MNADDYKAFLDFLRNEHEKALDKASKELSLDLPPDEFSRKYSQYFHLVTQVDQVALKQFFKGNLPSVNMSNDLNKVELEFLDRLSKILSEYVNREEQQ